MNKYDTFSKYGLRLRTRYNEAINNFDPDIGPKLKYPDISNTLFFSSQYSTMLGKNFDGLSDAEYKNDQYKIQQMLIKETSKKTGEDINNLRLQLEKKTPTTKAQFETGPDSLDDRVAEYEIMHEISKQKQKEKDQKMIKTIRDQFGEIIDDDDVAQILKDRETASSSKDPRPIKQEINLSKLIDDLPDEPERLLNQIRSKEGQKQFAIQMTGNPKATMKDLKELYVKNYPNDTKLPKSYDGFVKLLYKKKDNMVSY